MNEKGREIVKIIAVSLALVFALSSGAWAAKPYDEEVGMEIMKMEAAKAVNTFAFDVYRQLSGSEKEGNLFFSPYSISSVLAMTWAGAKGETALEMAKALCFDSLDAESMHAGMKALRERFGSIPENMGILAVANRLWLDRSENLLPGYTELVEQNYGTGVEQVDFLKNAKTARETINYWIEGQTRDKIKNLLRPGNVTPDTRLVLTNAIYFNSAWKVMFNKANTQERPFRIGKDEHKDVPMMWRTGHYLYGEEPSLQWIKIPYEMPGFSLMILLPRDNESFTQLEELESRLTPEALASWTADMKPREVELHMPKFRYEARYSLSEILKELGMKLAFTDNADFSGMMENALCIDLVIHQTFIELDEERTEAAAATAVTMMIFGSPIRREPPVVFCADHPFVYFLTDDVTGTILFMGRMTAP